jgi:hypothetical protein
VGASLLDYWQNWEAAGADPWALSVVKKGYGLEFIEYPRLLGQPPFQRSLCTKGVFLLNKEVQELVQTGAARELSSPFTPGFYSSILLVPKKDSGKCRLVINLKPLNQLLVRKPFRMETSRSITQSLSQGDWTVSLDLKDVYFHIPIHRESWKYLRFIQGGGGSVYEFVALHFGLASAPYVFTKISFTLAQVAHRQMLKHSLYLDDWLMNNGCRLRLLAQLPVLLSLSDHLGFVRNDEKSDLVPAQDFVFIGVWYNLVLAIARPPEDRWVKIQASLPSLLTRPESPAMEFLGSSLRFRI